MRIEYNNEVRERFIPVSYDEIVDGVLEYFKIYPKEEYEEFAKLLNLYYYNIFYPDLKKIKSLYSVFNPDIDTLTKLSIENEEYIKREKEFLNSVENILNNANYQHLTYDMLLSVMNKVSPYGVEVSVDFDDFEKIMIYFRGEAIQYDEIRDPKKLFLFKKPIRAEIYRRLFVLIKPKLLEKRAKEISEETKKDIKKVKKKLKKEKPHLIIDEKHKNIYIKLFKNIPHIDLEMLFPNTKVKMTLFDKVKLTIFGGGGTIGGASALATKLGAASLNPISTLIAVGGFLGILFRQVKEVMYKHSQYLAKLSQRLYFHNLDNNEGALTHIINTAFQEESKEALLAYLFLEHFESAVKIEQLDKAIEEYFRKVYNVEVDFEVSDGIRKLKELNLLYERNGYYTVKDLQEAKKTLKSALDFMG